MMGRSISLQEDDLSIVILAGGQSKRMGQDKALINWEGTPLLTRVSQKALTVSSQVFILCPWPERYKTILPSEIISLTERRMDEGPLSALEQALTKLSTPWILLLACDMPQLNSETLLEWRSQLSQLPVHCLAYVPKTQKTRWEPLCGFYRNSCHTSLKIFLDQGGRSFQKWLNSIDATEISIKPKQTLMFYNCNRPEDLASS